MEKKDSAEKAADRFGAPFSQPPPPRRSSPPPATSAAPAGCRPGRSGPPLPLNPSEALIPGGSCFQAFIELRGVRGEAGEEVGEHFVFTNLDRAAVSVSTGPAGAGPVSVNRAIAPRVSRLSRLQPGSPRPASGLK
jgi:hypothetical protein